MKRFFIIFLSLIVVIASYPVNVNAESFEPVTDNFSSLFDLSETEKRFYYEYGKDIVAPFDIGSETIYFSYIELLVYTYGTIDSVTINGKPTTIYRNGRSMRIVCDTEFSVSGSFDVVFDISSSQGWVYFVSAEYNSTFTTSSVVPTTIDTKFAGVTNTYNYNGSIVNLTADVSSRWMQDWEIRFLFYDYKFYDYINLSLFFNVSSFDSISCGIADTYEVPFSISVLNNDTFLDPELPNGWDVHPFSAKVSIDLRDINLSSLNGPLSFRFYGYSGNAFSDTNIDNSSPYNFCQVLGIYGFTVSSNTNPVIFWFRKLFYKLDNIFTGQSVDQANADSFNDSINDQADELEDLTADLNSVTRPPLSDVNLSTSGMVDQSVVVLATNGIGSILSNQIILRVLIMSLTFALAGFILFGKR